MAYLNDQNIVIRVNPINKNPTLETVTPAILKTRVSHTKGLIKRRTTLAVKTRRWPSHEMTEKVNRLNERRDKILNINSGLS